MVIVWIEGGVPVLVKNLPHNLRGMLTTKGGLKRLELVLISTRHVPPAALNSALAIISATESPQTYKKNLSLSIYLYSLSLSSLSLSLSIFLSPLSLSLHISICLSLSGYGNSENKRKTQIGSRRLTRLQKGDAWLSILRN